MNGVHDMGGMQGFGPVIREENEPVFHADWEKKMRAMMVCLDKNKVIKLDEVRYAIERVRPDYYLASSYYERWLIGLMILLLEKNVLNDDETREIRKIFSIDDQADLLGAFTQLKYVQDKEGITPEQTPEPSPKFKPGDKILTKMIHSKAHIRLPGYAKGKYGVVKGIYGNYKLPESNVYSDQPYKEPVYVVEFNASELWGPHAPGKDKVLIDLWESYLDPAAT
ncbi:MULTISPECIES: nitrile hydratase subunit beta [unclassified Paenibacillus]|uniref:nitrile hydratase subunit beta n=1 Tax=unclassified Paenibacillus TaxID=185978 RepID=UPI001AE9AB26|nr:MULTISPECIES: nitrile hydratase subunit beta [unclassified Paenibacillus]MBP1154082.1 nitrile hydratase [Paenibacillus sp. PvP091]MBP1170533.1 nitrile hydratase [Paenibacillus sp. PvR098]MBP2441561.1 nitrile hydratase [Paenibacillus sp. PvP052]